MNIDKRALKSIVDEIEASRARQKGETEHQREVMKRAKGHQLDTKAIRIVLQRRAMGETKREEQDYYVHAYEHALGGKKAAMEALENGATVREAAAAGGISTGAAGNLAKVVQNSSFVDAALEAGAPNPVRDGEASADERDASASSSPPGSPAAKASDAESPQGPLTTPDLADAAGGVDAPAPIADIDLTLPSFLDRRAAA